MKTIFLVPMFLSALSISSAWGYPSDPPLRASTVNLTQTMPAPNMILNHFTFSGSDIPSVDDPIGNRPLSARDKMGPPNTQNFGVDCREDACIRAHQRWDSPTNWRQDRAMGLSVGWGNGN